MKNGPVKRGELAIVQSGEHAKIEDGSIVIQIGSGPVEGKLVRATGEDVVYLLIDCSSSMRGRSKLAQAKQGAIDFAKQALHKGYLVGLIKFDGNVELLCEPQHEIEPLMQCTSHMDADGSTNMSAAIRLAASKLEGKGGLKAMVIATDGEPNNRPMTLSTARTARDNGIDIIVIGTDGANFNFLESIASRTELGDVKAVMVPVKELATGIESAALMLPEHS